MTFCFILLILTLVCVVNGYRVAFTTHTPLGIVLNATVPGVLAENLAKYDEYAQTATADKAQLILFPESGTGCVFDACVRTRASDNLTKSRQTTI